MQDPGYPSDLDHRYVRVEGDSGTNRLDRLGLIHAGALARWLGHYCDGPAVLGSPLRNADSRTLLIRVVFLQTAFEKEPRTIIRIASADPGGVGDESRVIRQLRSESAHHWSSHPVLRLKLATRQPHA